MVSRRVWMVLMGFGVLSCAQEAPEPASNPDQLVVEDVALPIDAAVDVDADPKAVARQHESVGGILPDDFPAHFSLPRPASIIDLSSEGEWAVVVLRTANGPGAVASFFARELPRGGWAEEAGVWQREGRLVRIAVKAIPDGSRVELSYR